MAESATSISPAQLASDVLNQYKRRYQRLLDQTTVYPLARWAAFGGVLLLFLLRIYYLSGWFIVCYGLGIYLLNLFIGFLSPQVDPDAEGPGLPLKTSSLEGGAEYKGFSRKLPEFKFWHSAFLAATLSLAMTFFSIFDIPVFWPILLLYFVALFVLTMKNQIAHMIKHRYLPFSWGKARYGAGGKGGGKGKPAIDRPSTAGIGAVVTGTTTGSNLAAAGGLHGTATHHAGPRFTGSNVN